MGEHVGDNFLWLGQTPHPLASDVLASRPYLGCNHFDMTLA